MVFFAKQNKKPNALYKNPIYFSELKDSIESFESAIQPTTEDKEMLFVSEEHYRREKNAFLLAKLALEVDERMKKENQEYYWSFNTPFSNEGSSFPKM